MFLLCALASIAQTRTIRGKIVDKAGSPVANVSVTVKGNLQGVSTELDGTFTLSVKVYFIAAEAAYHLNDNVKALLYLNAVATQRVASFAG